MEKLGKIIWTPTAYDSAKTCPLQYWFDNYSGLKSKTPKNPAMSVGILIHKMLEKKTFYKKDNSPKFKSPETFANTAKYRWLHKARTANSQESREKIKWQDKDQMYVLAYDIYQMCFNVYSRYVNEQPPLVTEFPVPTFDFDGRRFAGRFDDIRQYLTIRDHKTGKLKPSQFELDYDHKLTLYALIFAVYANQNQKFRLIAKVPEDDAESIGNEKNVLDDRIIIEYHHLRSEITPDGLKDLIANYQELKNKAVYSKSELTHKRLKTLENKLLRLGVTHLELLSISSLSQDRLETLVSNSTPILVTTRQNYHYNELVKKLDQLQKQIDECKREGEFIATRGKHCNYCIYQEKCDELTKGNATLNVNTQLDLFKPIIKPQVNATLKNLKLPFPRKDIIEQTK